MNRCLGCMHEYDEKYKVCPYCGYVLNSPPQEAYQLTPGTVLRGKYTVGKVLGNGGFGITYLGWDNVLQHKIAIKEYFPGEFSTRVSGQTKVSVYSGEREEQFNSGKEKFIEEAQRIAKFNKTKGIVHVYDYFEENGTAYIIMEYLEGETYKEKLKKRGVIPPEEARDVIIAVLEALEQVHAEGLVHRDIAPDNIMMTKKGEITILDFGASRFATTKHSKSLSIILKPGYAPEEQYQSRGNQGPWTDVYAVAATFYKLVTGITPQASIERSAKDLVKKPSKLGVSIPKNLENAVMNAMNIRIEDRTKSASEFLVALHAEKVKRKRDKIKAMDVGKWPLGVKIALPLLFAASITFLSLILSGTIHFDLKNTQRNQLEAGMTRVPNVINMTYEDAESLLEENVLSIHILEKEFSNDVDENKVLSQDIAAGEVLSENTVIHVVVSAGIEIKKVPNLVGLDSDEGKKKLDEVGMDYEVLGVYSSEAPGEIILQNIDPDVEVQEGDVIQILVSEGLPQIDYTKQTSMLDVVGMRFDEAKSRLLNNDLYISKDEVFYDETMPYGYITEQTIEKNEKVSLGTILGVCVNMAKGKIKVPELANKRLSEVRKGLEEQYFEIEIEHEYNDTVPKDSIIYTYPSEGNSVDVGSTLTLVVSDGKEQKYSGGGSGWRQYSAKTTAPKVVGLNVLQAVNVCYEYRVTPFFVGEYGDYDSRGAVIRQDPAEGAEMNAWDYLTFVYNKGPQGDSLTWYYDGWGLYYTFD